MPQRGLPHVKLYLAKQKGRGGQLMARNLVARRKDVRMGGWKTSFGKDIPTGEGMKMAFTVGAELRNLEFVRVWNMPRLFAWEGQTHLSSLGARFVNRLGENFMSRYSPILGSNQISHDT